MSVDQEIGTREAVVTKKRLPIRNFWKRDEIVGHREVASGPPPTFDELAPVDPHTGKSISFQRDFMDLVDKDGKKNEKP